MMFDVRQQTFLITYITSYRAQYWLFLLVRSVLVVTTVTILNMNRF